MDLMSGCGQGQPQAIFLRVWLTCLPLSSGSHTLSFPQAAGWAAPLLPRVQVLDSLLEVPECAGEWAWEAGGFSHSLPQLSHKWFCGPFIVGEAKGSHGISPEYSE